MGGELDKSTLNKKTHGKKDSSELGMTSDRNNKSKYKAISTDENLSYRKSQSKSAIKTTNNNNNNNELKRGAKKKKEKIAIVSKDKDDKNQEKKVLELIHEKNAEKEDYDIIYDIISKHFFLQTLNHQAKNEIIISMSLYSLKGGITLFEQGSSANYWYIVQSGELKRTMDDKCVGTIKAGESFGEHALMNNSPRSTTVSSVTDCRLWALKKQVFRKILEFIFFSG